MISDGRSRVLQAVGILGLFFPQISGVRAGGRVDVETETRVHIRSFYRLPRYLLGVTGVMNLGTGSYSTVPTLMQALKI